MSSRTDQIFVGSIISLIGAVGGAIATAVVNLLFAGKISLNNWWIWGIGAILGAVFFYIIYATNKFPFKKFRVTTNRRDGKSLLANTSKGRPVEDNAWLFADCSIYGPYLPIPLKKGKYKAIFKLKVDNISGENQHIITLDIVSNSNFDGDKTLARRTLTNGDFKQAGRYSEFPLEFSTFTYERSVELRIHSSGNHHSATLAYVRLSRRII